MLSPASPRRTVRFRLEWCVPLCWGGSGQNVETVARRVRPWVLGRTLGRPHGGGRTGPRAVHTGTDGPRSVPGSWDGPVLRSSLRFGRNRPGIGGTHQWRRARPPCRRRRRGTSRSSLSCRGPGVVSSSAGGARRPLSDVVLRCCFVSLRSEGPRGAPSFTLTFTFASCTRAPPPVVATRTTICGTRPGKRVMFLLDPSLPQTSQLA